MWEDTESESAESSGPMVSIAEESLGGKQCEVGDTLTFTVVSKEDGQVGLRMEGYDHGGGEEETEEVSETVTETV